LPCENFIIPEAQYAISLFLQPSCTFRIDKSFMLASVDFNYQPLLKANEIDNVMFNRLLTFEFETGKAPRSQLLPQRGFRIGGMAAHHFGELECSLGHNSFRVVTLSPTPPPSRGRG